MLSLAANRIFVLLQALIRDRGLASLTALQARLRNMVQCLSRALTFKDFKAVAARPNLVALPIEIFVADTPNVREHIGVDCFLRHVC